MTGVTLPSTAEPGITRPCLRCGYDLRGLGDRGNCPECGLAVALSAVPGDELRHAPPRWLASLAWGTGLVMAAMVFAVVAGRLVGPRLGVVSIEAYVSMQVSLALVFAAGVWLLTRPQPRFGPSGPAWRWSLRVVSLGPMILPGAEYLAIQAGIRGPVHIALLAVALFALSAIPVLLLIHLRRLALRVLDRSLAEHCAIVGFAGSASFALSGSLLFFRLRPVIELVAATGVILCYLWTLYLLIRFTIAFARAQRASAKSWRIVA